jgi:DNA-binding SARP family transcriptional activator
MAPATAQHAVAHPGRPGPGAVAGGLAGDVLARLPYDPVRVGRRPAAALPTLRIRALGDLRVDGPDGSLGGAWLDQRAGELLRFLVCARDRVTPADAIADAIWPHLGRAGSNTLRHFVHALRERLEPDRERHAGSSYVICRRGGYALDPQRVWIDVDAFERDVTDGLRAFAAGNPFAATVRLERAIALYVDDLLTDEPYAEWVLRERERCRALACDTLRALAALRAGEPAAAAAYLDRLAEMEPFDDEVQRELITAWLRLGRRSRAARHYESFRIRLAREFGQRPTFELSEL